MAKLIIFSIVLVTFGVPIWLSAAPQPRLALRKTQRLLLGYIVIWVLMCVYWYPSLVHVE